MWGKGQTMLLVSAEHCARHRLNLPLLYRVVIPVPIFEREEINSFPRLYKQKLEQDSKPHVFDSKPVHFALSQGMC